VYWVIKLERREDLVATVGQDILAAWVLVYDVLPSLSASKMTLDTLVKRAES
jgi:hypothetical protein